MMSEELDFEAEIPVSTNCKQLNEMETSLVTKVKKELSSDVQSDIKDGVKSDSGEEKCDGAQAKVKIVTDRRNAADANVVESETDGMEQLEGLNSRERMSDTGEIESDTGEIHSDSGGEIPEKKGELEEGELDDEAPAQTKTADGVCRYYQRGTCLYGLDCRNAHVSNGVYNMFDSSLNKGFFRPFGFPNFHRPPVFPPIMPLMPPENENMWERGIRQAKVVMKNNGIRKEACNLNLENDWERCLEEAKANIRRQTPYKRKELDDDKPYCDDPKYYRQEKIREKSPMIDYKGSDKNFPKSKYSKVFYSRSEKESNYNKKIKPSDMEGTPDHLKWVDPWQRSKSPPKRTRSMSLSVSPSPSRRSRDRSVSSSSSASSYFENIYRGNAEAKSPIKRSRTSSHSVSPPSKRIQTSEVHNYNKTRSYSRSVTRSFSKSPRKRLHSGSSSSGCSEKLGGRNKSYGITKYPKMPLRTESKGDKRFISNDRTKADYYSSTTKYYNKSHRGKSFSRSRSSSASSLSCTSISSLSDDNLMSNTPGAKDRKNSSAGDPVSLERKTYRNQKIWEKNDSAPNAFGRRSQEYNRFRQNQHSPDRSRQAPSQDYDRVRQKHYSPNRSKQTSQEYERVKQRQYSPDRSKQPSQEYDRVKQKQYSPDRSKQLMLAANLKTKPNNEKAGSSQSSTEATKPVKNKNEKQDQRSSQDAMALLRFRTLGEQTRSYPSNPVTKPPQPKTTPPPAETPKAKSEPHPKIKSEPHPKIKSEPHPDVPEPQNLAPKVPPEVQSRPQPIKFNISTNVHVKKEAVSKRKMLLQQLQAIEDAIARKKQVPQ